MKKVQGAGGRVHEGTRFALHLVPCTVYPLEFQSYPNEIIYRRLREVSVICTLYSIMLVSVYPCIGLILNTENVIQLEMKVNILDQPAVNSIHYPDVVDKIWIQCPVIVGCIINVLLSNVV